MKKLLFFLSAIILFTFTACEGPMGPMGPSGLDGLDGQNGKDGSGANWYQTSFTISPDEWELVDENGDPGVPIELNTYFVVDKPLDKLTEKIYKEGAVIAYIETDNDVKNGLPYVLHLGGEDSKGEFLWTETTDFDFYPGGVSFRLTYSDFNTQLRPNEDKTFHVVLMW